MKSSNDHFGLVVAYLLPGFIALAGLVPLFPLVKDWLQPMEQSAIGFGPTIYAILFAIAAGMIVSCIRWLVIDQLHHWAGTVQPDWNDMQLDENLEAFNYIVEAHYRYYQFYANTLIAIVFAYGTNRLMHTSPLLGVGTDLGVITLCAVLFVGSRDTLAKYYTRTRRLTGVIAEKDLLGAVMTNGNHQAQEASSSEGLRAKTPSPPKKRSSQEPRRPNTSKPTK